MTHPVPNTSSMGSSDCSQVDRFSKHFEKCRHREGHVKASVCLLPTDVVIGILKSKNCKLLNVPANC